MEDKLVISRFEGEFDFLSNFYPSPVTYLGVTYPTAEHAYQAQKTYDQKEHDRILMAPTPGRAKRIGKTVKCHPSWNTLRVDVMKGVIWSKFSQNPGLGQRLLATGNVTLIEGNVWGDRFWGQVDGFGENMLGKILMEVRTGLLDFPDVAPDQRINS